MGIKLPKFKSVKHIPGSQSAITLQIARDKFQAQRKGLDWTEFRLFVSYIESKDSKCSRCQKLASHVRYHARNSNKDALCEACYQSHLEKVRKDQAFLNGESDESS